MTKADVEVHGPLTDELKVTLKELYLEGKRVSFKMDDETLKTFAWFIDNVLQDDECKRLRKERDGK